MIRIARKTELQETGPDNNFFHYFWFCTLPSTKWQFTSDLEWQKENNTSIWAFFTFFSSLTLSLCIYIYKKNFVLPSLIQAT